MYYIVKNNVSLITTYWGNNSDHYIQYYQKNNSWRGSFKTAKVYKDFGKAYKNYIRLVNNENGNFEIHKLNKDRDFKRTVSIDLNLIKLLHEI
jgi:hypothetical protein